MNYSTSEILSLRTDERKKILVVYGKKDSEGELQIHSSSALSLKSPRRGVAFHSEEGGLLATLVYEHKESPQEIILENTRGEEFHILVLNPVAAGRTWFLKSGQREDILIGPRLARADGQTWQIEMDDSYRDIWLYSRQPLFDFIPFYEGDDGSFSRYHVPPKTSADFHLDLGQGESADDSMEKNVGFEGPGFFPFPDGPGPLEKAGIYEGHGWYRTQFDLTAAEAKNPGPLYLESVSDFAGIYINGEYLLTVAPLGTEVNSGSRFKPYGFALRPGLLKAGRNSLVIRSEIWGHGSFMFPRGSIKKIPLFSLGTVPLPGLRLSFPALGFDAMKGVSGITRLGKKELKAWELRAGLGREKSGFPRLDGSLTWAESQLPLRLEAGAVRWYRTSFQKDQLPAAFDKKGPLALVLRGRASKATIWLNGRIVGRWLSDTDWLGRGTWSRPLRDMWMNSDPDAFPLSLLGLKEGENTLDIALEDCSDQTRGEKTGELNSLTLKWAREEKGPDGLRSVLTESFALQRF